MTLAELTCALSRACAVPLAAAPCPNPSMGCAGPPSATHAGAEGAACLWRQLAASQREAADTYSGDRPAAVVLPLGCPNRVRSSAERRLHSMVAFSLGHSYPPSRFAGASEPPAVRSAPARSQSTARARSGSGSLRSTWRAAPTCASLTCPRTQRVAARAYVADHTDEVQGMLGLEPSRGSRAVSSAWAPPASSEAARRACGRLACAQSGEASARGIPTR